MTVEDVKRLYEAIGEDESLRSEFEGLESQDEVIDRMLEVGENRGIDAGRSDVEAFLEQLEERAEKLDEEELDGVAGGSGPCGPCIRVTYKFNTLY